MTYADLVRIWRPRMKDQQRFFKLMVMNQHGRMAVQRKRNKAAGEGHPKRHAHQVPAQVLGSIIPVLGSVE